MTEEEKEKFRPAVEELKKVPDIIEEGIKRKYTFNSQFAMIVGVLFGVLAAFNDLGNNKIANILYIIGISCCALCFILCIICLYQPIRDNKFDKDAIAVYNADYEIVGHVANSERTLSPNNRKNGNISASELKGEIDFSGKEFYGEVIKAFSSCLYLEVNEGKWSYINRSVPTVAIADTVGISEVDVLKSEIDSL